MKIKCFSKRKLNVRISKTKIKCAILGFSQNCCILGKSREKLVKFSNIQQKFSKFFCNTWPRAGATRRLTSTTERHPEGCRSVRPKGPDNVKIGMSLEFYSPAAAVSRNGAAGRGRFPKRRCVPRRENEIREPGSLQFLHV